jgi:hypothetical protein
MRTTYGNERVNVISRRHLIRNKRDRAASRLVGRRTTSRRRPVARAVWVLINRRDAASLAHIPAVDDPVSGQDGLRNS